MPQALLQLGDWMPDSPVMQAVAPNVLRLTLASGVYPRPDQGYGPLPGSTVTSPGGGLSARCQGAFATKTAEKDVEIFAGDATMLYRLVSSAFTNVSQAGNYTIAAEEFWKFARFGDIVIACNVQEQPQKFTLDSSTLFEDLAGTPPKARFVATIEPGFLFLGGCDTGSGVLSKYLRWSAINDPESYPTLGTAAAAAVESDFQEFPIGGDIMGIVGGVGGAQGVIFLEESIIRVDYIGPPAIFRFSWVEDSRGTYASNSIVKVGATCFYLGDDGFYAFDGARSVPIGKSKVDRYFLADIDTVNLHRVQGIYDHNRDLIIWAYPGSNAESGNPDKWLIFSPSTGRWSLNDDATAECELLFPGLANEYTLDTLDAIVPDLDASDVSLDSSVYAKSSNIIAGFDTDHEVAFYSAAAIAGRIETAEHDGGAGRWMRVNGVRPLVDGGTLTAQIGYRAGQADAVTYTSATSPHSRNGICPQRITSRYFRTRVNIAAGGTWEKAFAVEVDAHPDGTT